LYPSPQEKGSVLEKTGGKLTAVNRLAVILKADLRAANLELYW
jgi:hypothetical protein